jgi:predicted AlkP superfamily pyrophosphatase or phosphodiesterase
LISEQPFGMVAEEKMKLLTCRMIGVMTLVWMAMSAAVFAENSPRVHHVFIISFDQGNPDLFEKADMPVFHKMTEEGAHTWEAYTIVPSLTLPSHTSMLTGVGPQKHQVLWNDYEPEKGLVKVPTIFSIAKEKGLVTAMFVGKEKFKHLDVPGSLDAFVWPQPEDNAMAVAQAFASAVPQLKPNLCFIHLRDPDDAGHKYGVTSPEKVQAMVTCDHALKTIKDAIAGAGLLDDSVIIMTADHGSHDITNSLGQIKGTHGDATTADVEIPWVAWGKTVKPGFTVTAPVLQYDTAATALWLLGIPVPEYFWGRPVTSAFE